jgi:aminoglycoside/choline kinase family phosphotransferase/dTDP-glucose pyrophosphorylase
MQAMILAAGMGTRLRPHTYICPKPLFAIDGQPIIHRTILQLIANGFNHILINIHYLSDKIKAFIAQQQYDVPICLCHENDILGTGGGIKNMISLVQSFPVLVVNSDIVTNLNFKTLYESHLLHDDPVTLIVHDEPRFNTVKIDQQTVCSFRCSSEKGNHIKAFTGIHVIDALVGDYIPEHQNYSIITAYEKMIQDGQKIHVHEVNRHYWADIGTPEGYAGASAKILSQSAFKEIGSNLSMNSISSTKLKGDGSDRQWFRYECLDQSLVMVNHGISCLSVPGVMLEKKDYRSDQSCTEVESFVAIGKHLEKTGVPVPRIVYHDIFSGIVFVEDLGNVHFQDYIFQFKEDQKLIESAYKTVIDMMIHMSTSGAVDFDSRYTCQTDRYDSNMILKFECQYFLRSFIQDFMELSISFSDIEKEMSTLVNDATQNFQWGFMHRDFQSRNIMVKDDQFYVIDFQSARWGPMQYDLASLLIDPYVGLSNYLQDRLVQYCLKKLKHTIAYVDDQQFYETYQYCRLFRNLQMLGAFAFLSQNKGKKTFQQYIPPALSQLNQQLNQWALKPCNHLRKLLNHICQ